MTIDKRQIKFCEEWCASYSLGANTNNFDRMRTIELLIPMTMRDIYLVYTGCFEPVRNRFQVLSGLIKVNVNAPKLISKRLEMAKIAFYKPPKEVV